MEGWEVNDTSTNENSLEKDLNIPKLIAAHNKKKKSGAFQVSIITILSMTS